MSIHSVNSTQSIYSIESFLVLTKKGCPIRKSTDLRLFAPTRGLSQLITSFIASMCLGIHRTPLVAFTKDFSILRKRVDAYANQIVKKQSKKYRQNHVELTGIEPATSGLQSPRSPNWATAPESFDRNLPTQNVGLGRLELPTSRLSGVRSNHLSYKPIFSRWTIHQNQPILNYVVCDVRSIISSTISQVNEISP